MYRYVLFDLDGTLTDSGEGITNSVAYALRKQGITVEDRTELYPFIGPPLTDSLMRFYGFSEEQALQGVKDFREYFRDKGIFENALYDGILPMLQSLKEAGCTLVLATSKPEAFAVRIMEHFGLRQYFDHISAATMDESRNEKADIIRYAIDTLPIRELSEAVMVGDRKHDILGAKTCGLKSVGVLYGYGSREELEAAGADYLAARPEDVAEICGKKT